MSNSGNCHLSLVVDVITSCSLTQEVAGSNFFTKKIHRIQWKYLKKSQVPNLRLTDPIELKQKLKYSRKRQWKGISGHLRTWSCQLTVQRCSRTYYLPKISIVHQSFRIVRNRTSSIHLKLGKIAMHLYWMYVTTDCSVLICF